MSIISGENELCNREKPCHTKNLILSWVSEVTLCSKILPWGRKCKNVTFLAKINSILTIQFLNILALGFH